MSRGQSVGLGLTAVAVAVLVGSLVMGVRGEPAAGADAAGEAGNTSTAPERRVRVEVLNGAGIAHLAQSATEQLRDHGFDVVYYGNADSFGQDTSVVIDRVGRLADAEAVARAIGIARVESHPDSSLFLEATVVIGKDWAGIPEPATDPPPPSPSE